MLSITKLVTVILLVLASPFLNPLSEDFSGLVTSFHQDEQHVCSIYIYTDPFLWRQVYKMEGKLKFLRIPTQWKNSFFAYLNFRAKNTFMKM